MKASADALGVAPTTVAFYRSRGRLPEPVAYVNGIPVWTRRQMERYLIERPGQDARTDLT